MNRLASLALLACLALPAAVLAQPAVPTLISYHGRVVDSSGALIGAGSPVNRTVTFRIYRHKSNSGADRLWSESQTVTIANGEFSVLLGTGTAVAGESNAAATLDLIFNSSSITGSSDRYLGVTVDDGTAAADTEINPRQQIVTSAFALRAKVAEGLSGAITGAQIAAGSITTAQIAPSTITAGNLAASFYNSYPTFTNGLRADIGLNVNHPGAADTTLVFRANATNTYLLHLLDASGISRMHVTTAGGIVATSLSGALNGSNIVDNSIPQSKLSFTPGVTDNSVTTAKIADGSVTAAKLSSSFGYAQFPQGARADIGLNLNHAGIGGNTSTMKANGTDHTILQLQNSSGNAVWDVKTTGEMGVAGRATLYGGLTVNAGGASIAGDASFGNTLGVSGATTLAALSATTGSFSSTLSVTGATTLSGSVTADSGLRVNGRLNVNADGASDTTFVVKGRSSSDTYLANFANELGNSAFYVTRLGNGQFAGSVTANNVSDIRLKRDVRNLDGTLEKILRLRSVTFEYVDPEYGAGLQTGFVAQEMEPVFPEWVKTRDDGIKMISYRGFESVAVRAIQELRAEKESQLKQRDATIAALEKNVAAMKSEAAETKARLAALEQVLAKFTASGSN